MSKSIVALMRCDSYEESKVHKAVLDGVDLLGGILSFVQPGEKIVIKPNVLFGSHPDKCVTTHPLVLKAVGEILKQAGIDIRYGDSPGVGSCERHIKRAGFEQISHTLGIRLVDFNNGKFVTHKDALLCKHFVIANGVLESDGLISLSKLKAHQLTRITGAIKNQFGCIPGILKSEYHMRMPDPYDFSKMLVDINTFIKPRLYIMDAIIAMEGNGPRNGKPKKLGALLLSNDPVALDSIAAKIVALNPECVPTLLAGELAGLGTYHYENIEVVGEDITQFIDPDFEVCRTPPISSKGGCIRKFLKNRISQRPVISNVVCTKCGTCVDICPVNPKAVNMLTDDRSKSPTYKYNQCIRCYCCQESCPEGAITVKDTPLGLIFRKVNVINRI